MMNDVWNLFLPFAGLATALSLAGAVVALLGSQRARKAAIGLSAAGLAVYVAFVTMLWLGMQRPPLKTMAETRLWYSLLMSLTGLVTFCRWRYRWILLFSTIMSAVFAALVAAHPEMSSQPLMPALQSIWFVPHVVLYMFSYALLGCSFLLAVAGSVNDRLDVDAAVYGLVKGGVALFTVAMIMGAVWAKQAWGDFWTWDPKESWAAVTWLIYLLYMHLHASGCRRRKLMYACLIVAFCSLQMCWWGVNLLPSASQSVHLYTE